MSNSLIAIINLLVLLFAGVAASTFIRSRTNAGTAAALVIAAATLIGLANAFFPPLVALRDSAPLVQPLMVLGLTAGLLAVGLQARGRDHFRAADVRSFIALHSWRLLFGLLLLTAGLTGALPPGFFWTVALGDIAAGIWAISISRRGSRASPTELKLWSAFGLVDLLHLLPRAVITLPPFYATHPDLFRPILLPLLGVPMLIALHILLLRRFLAGGDPLESTIPQSLRERT